MFLIKNGGGRIAAMQMHCIEPYQGIEVGFLKIAIQVQRGQKLHSI